MWKEHESWNEMIINVMKDEGQCSEEQRSDQDHEVIYTSRREAWVIYRHKSCGFTLRVSKFLILLVLIVNFKEGCDLKKIESEKVFGLKMTWFVQCLSMFSSESICQLFAKFLFVGTTGFQNKFQLLHLSKAEPTPRNQTHARMWWYSK